jgi:spore coat polysaccharide biosynthesis protein SpsF
VAPDDLPAAYAVLHDAAERYVLLAEYFAKTPTEVQYRGQDRALWRRDFAGEFLDMHPNMRLRDYGFAYSRDAVAPQDDLTWMLMERI